MADDEFFADQPEPNALRADKFDRLIRERDTIRSHNPKWSRFVRRMRLILPVIALALFAVIFVWGDIQNNNIIPTQEAAKLAPTIGKNELVNPRFESIDKDNQPFTFTAERAVQDSTDENLVMLEKPTGDMKLNSGDTIGINAQRGSFRQNNKILLLRGDVKLTHDKGYELTTQELDFDLMKNTALSQVDVIAKGPEGTITAKGLQGESDTGHLIFNGPAKLILTNVSGGPKEMLP